MTRTIRQRRAPGLGVLAVTAAMALVGSPVFAQALADVPVLRVTGEGRIEVAPDMAVITLGVQSRAKTARATLGENSERVTGVLDSLRAAGIAARDMQTSGLSLGPEWQTYRGDGQNPARVTGYVATNMVTVRVRDLPALGGILDKIVRSGANSFNGLQFTASNLDEVRDAARRAAVQDARRKADLYAGAAGVTLGPIQNLTEGGTGGMPRPLVTREMAVADSSVPVAGGEITISATVEMEYSISE